MRSDTGRRAVRCELADSRDFAPARSWSCQRRPAVASARRVFDRRSGRRVFSRRQHRGRRWQRVVPCCQLCRERNVAVIGADDEGNLRLTAGANSNSGVSGRKRPSMIDMAIPGGFFPAESAARPSWALTPSTSFAGGRARNCLSAAASLTLMPTERAHSVAIFSARGRFEDGMTWRARWVYRGFCDRSHV